MGKISIATISVFIFSLFSLVTNTVAQETEWEWLQGPAVGTIGDNVAEVQIDEGYIFTGPEGTIELMEYMGNPPSNMEAGFIAPNSDTESWFIVFEYNPVGYISDKDSDKLDSDAIFESIRKGTEAANKIREENGQSKLHLKGWFLSPNYDSISHNLVWALLAEDDNGEKVVNYNIRLLGRHGYMSAVLVATPEEFNSYSGELERIVSTVTYKKGKDYASFVQGDKVAKYGLTALVAGGVGAAAAKTGILKVLLKSGKAIFIAIFAAIAGFFKWFANLFKRRGKNQ